MNKEEIFSCYRGFYERFEMILKDDPSVCIVAGAACVVHGVRESCNNIDLQVSNSSYKKLLPYGSTEISRIAGVRSERLQIGRFDIIVSDYGGEDIDDVPVQRVKYLRKMKERMYKELGRRKDFEDLERLRVLI